MGGKQACPCCQRRHSLYYKQTYPLLWRGNSNFIFQNYINKYPWKDSWEQRAISASPHKQCRSVRDPWRALSSLFSPATHSLLPLYSSFLSGRVLGQKICQNSAAVLRAGWERMLGGAEGGKPKWPSAALGGAWGSSQRSTALPAVTVVPSIPVPSQVLPRPSLQMTILHSGIFRVRLIDHPFTHSVGLTLGIWKM